MSSNKKTSKKKLIVKNEKKPSPKLGKTIRGEKVVKVKEYKRARPKSKASKFRNTRSVNPSSPWPRPKGEDEE
jgi:hypothetical protein